MSEITLGILGGGQLGSMLSIAAKKLKIKTVIYSDDKDAPAQNFCDVFIFAKWRYDFNSPMIFRSVLFESLLKTCKFA